MPIYFGLLYLSRDKGFSIFFFSYRGLFITYRKTRSYCLRYEVGVSRQKDDGSYGLFPLFY